MATVRGQQTITNLSVATGLTIAPSSSYAWVQAESANIRFWLGSGVTPVSATGAISASGMILRYSAYEPLVIDGGLSTAKFIKETVGTNPKLLVTYFS
jgi:hypothetical protein